MVSKTDNYFATVVKINSSGLIPLKGLDRLCHVNIFGNKVLVSNTIPDGTVGVFFPLECQINHEFLKANNLYRDNQLNQDTSKKGYFEDSGRVKAQKFQGHKSMGFFIELSSLNYLGLPELPSLGTEFNSIDNKVVCKKYVVKNNFASTKVKSKADKVVKVSQLVDNQFRLHYDTSQFGRNLHMVEPNDWLTITNKLHGTSGVSSNILVNRPLSYLERFAKWCGVQVVDTQYGNIYSSRKVIKNEYINQTGNHYYNVDIWGVVNEYLKMYIPQGFTLYYEIVGYLPSGEMIQKDYDYGCERPKSNEDYAIGKHCKVYIYRVTITNPKGNVYELSAPEVQVWCKENGLLAVPLLWYGKASELGQDGQSIFNTLESLYLEKDCNMCVGKVPAEGIVIRIGENAYKMKSFAFYQRETKELDSGIINLEDNQEEN